ncbi:MAG TPA: aspartate/glutamate racemase family protein [Aromatoleum sp.]|uniref:aspartate/glutamate racemase family protein n=1 Tax=Aromatoleum sp. TaxID=2307007 RepID=UPI002B459D4E|nr:aspartate/glutamate racemase family protein [Aromatoleum sp.]HJV27436.1 aspartate/glutamate racemase family protein [Aromatoleum sp.]
MKLLLLNPNTSQSVTDRIANAAIGIAGPQTELVTATAPRGVPYIATRAEAVIGGAVALEMLAEMHSSVDAAIIAAFGDPGLGGARELFPIPVIGLAEAGMLTACMLGKRFAIVTFSQSLEAWYQECVAWHGLRERCAGVRALGGSFRSISDVQDEKEALLVDLAKQAVDQDGADVVVLAGAPLAGLARRVRDRIPVPVIDCVEAAVKQAETLAALNPRKAEKGTFARPGPKPCIGIAEPLARWINHE